MNISPRLTELFLQLAKIDGLSGAERDVNRFICKFLRQIDIDCVEDDVAHQVGGNSGNLICRIGEEGNFVILAHMDTARSTQNLKPIITKDRITSDGTTILGADNRAGITAILYNLEKAKIEKIPLRDHTIVFTVCEETSLGGSKHVQLGEQIQMGFVVDSSMRPGQFIYRTYGSQGFNIQVTGKAAHSGIHPEDGISSIQVAAQAIANLQLGRVDLETTANIGIIQGGTATNVIPEKTSLAGEVRSLQIEKVHQVIQKIRTEFQNTGQKFNAKVEFESHWDFKPFYVKSGSAAYDKIVITLQALGINPEPVITAGGSDANSLNAKGISAVNIGIGAQNPHSNSEFILLEDLQKTADIVLQLMKAT